MASTIVELSNRRREVPTGGAEALLGLSYVTCVGNFKEGSCRSGPGGIVTATSQSTAGASTLHLSTTGTTSAADSGEKEIGSHIKV